MNGSEYYLELSLSDNESMVITLLSKGKLTFIELINFPADDCVFVLLAFCAKVNEWYCLLRERSLASAARGRPDGPHAKIDKILDNIPAHGATAFKQNAKVNSDDVK